MPRVLIGRGFVFAAATWFSLSVVGAADRPAQYCLPDETLFVVRVPAAAKFLEAIKTRTKIGAIVTSEARLAGLQKLLRDEAGEDLDKLTAGLDRLGLTADDWWKSLDAEWGYAGLLLPSPADAASPQYAGLAWSQSDDALIDKWFAALDRKMQDQKEGKAALRREDIELAGKTIVHLTIPILGPPHGKLSVSLGLNSKAGIVAGIGVESDDKAGEPAEVEEKDFVEVAQAHLLLARGEDRLTLVHSQVSLVEVEGAAGPQGLAAAAATVEKLRETLARFLAAARESDEGIVRRWEQTRGLADALPEGEPLVEGYLNLPRLVTMLNVPGNEEVWKFAQAAGLEKLGPLGYRATLDGTAFRSGLFVAVPAPRPGLLALLDQAPLNPAPADWVAKTAVGYQHISFDLGKAYQTVSQVMRESYPRGEGALHALENQTQAFLQTDPTTLLASLGKTHTILTYLPTLTEEEDARRANRDDAAAQTAMAFVWTPTGEALWRKLMQMLGAAAAQPVVVEQGFTGIRYQQDQLHGSWFIGNGYMILAIGQGVTEKVLANLRTTPRPDESLRGTDYARRAAELLPGAGTLSFDLTDGAGLLRFADSVMQRAFADVADTTAAKLKQLWPTEQEWQGAIGVSASAVTIDSNGLIYRSVLDLPAP